MSPDDELDTEEAEALGHRAPLDIYLGELRRIPLLTREQETELAKQVADGSESARRMVESNLRLVVMLARRYQGRGLPLPDLIAEGNLGLIRAVEKFRLGSRGPASPPTPPGGSARPSSGPSPTRRD